MGLSVAYAVIITFFSMLIFFGIVGCLIYPGYAELSRIAKSIKKDTSRMRSTCVPGYNHQCGYDNDDVLHC